MKGTKMAEESTPEVQESATESATLDAILEGSIGEVMEKEGGDPIPSKEETETSSLPDIPKEAEVETEGSEELDQKATDEEEEAPEEETSPSEETEEEAEKTEESEDTSLSAPDNWNEDDSKMFDSLPNEAKERLLKREKEMTADYTRKTQDLANQRKELEALDKVLEPARHTIAATGIGEAEYISRLLNADAALRQNPQMALRQLAQGYGINLPSDNTESESWDDPDPQYAQMQKQLQAVQGELNQFKQHNIQAARSETENQINVFSEQKDADGNLKHPHFDKLRVKMGNLIDAGEAKGMEEAYNKALRLDDDLYAETLKTQTAKAKKEEEKKRKLAVEKARKVKPKTSANPPKGSVKTSDLDALLMTNIEGAGITR